MGIWKNFEHENINLKENINVDILIIGAGLTGMMTAYYLKHLKNKNICIVDSLTIGQGVTKNTTAKITYFQERIYTRIKSLRGEYYAKLYLNSQLKAIKEYEKIIKTENIDCDFTKTPSYVFTNNKNEVKKLEKEIEFLKNNNINVEKSPLPLNTKYYTSYKVEDTYTFNPLKFLRSIHKILKEENIQIYENTKVYDVKKEQNYYICNCGTFNIKAKKIIWACNYPYFLFPLMMPLKSYIEKSYIIISKVEDYKNISVINTSIPSYSCRFYKDNENIYQISLGSSHNTAFKMNDKENFNKVKELFKLDDKNIIMKYTNTDIMTFDNLPLIGEINTGMYNASSYNTWGMTNSLIAAYTLKDLITSGVSEYKNIFNPKRITLANIIKIPLYILNGIKSYTQSKIFKNKSWYNNVEIKNGIGVYTDENGIMHKVKTKCPHLGCGLIFNEVEKTWDCPCHSSKFDIDGNLLKGPSNKNIKID